MTTSPAVPFVQSVVVSLAGFGVIQFGFEGWPTMFVAIAGALVGIAALAPVGGWIIGQTRAEAEAAARDVTVGDFLRAHPETIAVLVREGLAPLVDGDVMAADFPELVRTAEGLALAVRDVAAHGRARLREVELRKAL